MRSGAAKIRIGGLGGEATPEQWEALKKRVAVAVEMGWISKEQAELQLKDAPGGAPELKVGRTRWVVDYSKPGKMKVDTDPPKIGPPGRSKALERLEAQERIKSSSSTMSGRFVDWWRCDNKKGPWFLPDAAARGVCYARNFVIIAGVTAGWFVLMSVTKD